MYDVKIASKISFEGFRVHTEYGDFIVERCRDQNTQFPGVHMSALAEIIVTALRAKDVD